MDPLQCLSVRNDSPLFHLIRRTRLAALAAGSLVDAPANWLNDKRPWPPIQMRREVGPLRVFEGSAHATVESLRHNAGLRPGSRFLDVGCGCGAIPLALTMYGPHDGTYHGLDVDKRMIRWCTRHLASSGMRFSHHDYWSALYNPKGTRMLPLSVEDGWADVVLMKSVLTHLLPDDTVWYLQETARVLAPDGTAVLTAVLYDEVSPSINRLFPHDGGVYRFLRSYSPESSIALKRSWVDEQVARAGLSYVYEPGVVQGSMIVRHAGLPAEPLQGRAQV